MNHEFDSMNKDIPKIPNSDPVTLAQNFVINNFSQELVSKARVDIFNRNNSKMDLKTQIQENIKGITYTIISHSKSILKTQENVDKVTKNGFGDILFASVISAHNPLLHSEFIIGKKITPEETIRERKIKFYKGQIKKTKDNFYSLSSDINTNRKFNTVIININKLAGIGEIVLLKKILKQGYKNFHNKNEKFLNDLINQSEKGNLDIHHLVSIFVNSGLAGAPEAGVTTEKYIQRLVREIETVNKQCEIPENKDKNKYVIPIGSPEFVYNKLGISQEHLAEGLRFLIKSELTNTKLFTRICAGIDYSKLPSDLQDWFTQQGLVILPFNIVFDKSVSLGHCHEVGWGMCTDLNNRGIVPPDKNYVNYDGAFSSSFAVIGERKINANPPDHGADIVIGEICPWWTEHSNIVSLKFIIGKDKTGGILVPSLNDEMGALYVTKRGEFKKALENDDDQNIKKITFRLPIIDTSYFNDLFQEYVSYARGKKN